MESSSRPASSLSRKLGALSQNLHPNIKRVLFKVAPAVEEMVVAHGAPRMVSRDELFAKTDPAVDGVDCDQDCTSCTIKYPAKFSIDETAELYGHVNGFDRHIIVATGKTDWVRDVAEEKGSIMEAVQHNISKHNRARLMVSASNIPVPEEAHQVHGSTTCLLLPAFKIVENVTPASTSDMITHIINQSSTTADQLTTDSSDSSSKTSLPAEIQLTTRDCPHDYLVLLCSQKTRDARCGQSAPLLRREFERHLRSLGLYRDLHDDRPGGVGIYFISHVGGHKFSANVMIYRRIGTAGASIEDSQSEQAGDDKSSRQTQHAPSREAAQCMWIARVRPEDCENIVKYTILQGKLVKPERQLRGGFDRRKHIASW